MPAKVRSFCKRHRAFLLSGALFALLCVLLTRAGQRPDRYTVQAEWDAQARTLRVEQTVLLTNRTGAALSVLDFHLYANAFSQEESAPVLPQERKYAYPEGFSPGGAEVAAVQVNGRDVPWELSGEGDTVLRVFLPFRLRPQGGVEVRLSYSVALSDNRLRTGVSARDVRLCNAFATLCAHDGESFRHDAYGAIGDPFVSACASWEVHLRAPTSLVAAGPGLVSASEGSWTFSGENLRDFALVLSPWRRARWTASRSAPSPLTRRGRSRRSTARCARSPSLAISLAVIPSRTSRSAPRSSFPAAWSTPPSPW